MTVAQMEARLLELREAVPVAARSALGTLGQRSTAVVRGLLSGNRLAVRSGRLRNSVGMEVKATGVGIELEVWAGRDANVKYAALQEHGGVVKPVKPGVKSLAIPVGPARTGAGGTRGGWESPRTAPVKLRYVPVERGNVNGILVVDTGKGKRARQTTAYILVKRVKIKPTHYMRDTADAAKAAFPEMFTAALERAVRR